MWSAATHRTETLILTWVVPPPSHNPEVGTNLLLSICHSCSLPLLKFIATAGKPSKPPLPSKQAIHLSSISGRKRRMEEDLNVSLNPIQPWCHVSPTPKWMHEAEDQGNAVFCSKSNGETWSCDVGERIWPPPFGLILFKGFWFTEVFRTGEVQWKCIMKHSLVSSPNHQRFGGYQ